MRSKWEGVLSVDKSKYLNRKLKVLYLYSLYFNSAVLRLDIRVDYKYFKSFFNQFLSICKISATDIQRSAFMGM